MFGLKVSTNVDGESAFLLFDAITAYSKSLTGTTTKHPIATGSNISSHFIADKPVTRELDEQDPLYNIFKPKAQSPSEFYNK